MGAFHDRLNEFGSAEGAVFPDGMFDALLAAYDEDFSVPSAAVADRDAQLGEANTNIAALKAKMFDLMQTAAVAPVPPEAGETFDDPDGEGDDDDDADIDDFFDDSPDDDDDK